MGIARSGIGWLAAKVATLGISFLALLWFTRAFEDPRAVLGTFQTFEMVAMLSLIVVNAGLGQAAVKRISEGEAPERFFGATVLLSAGLLVVISLVLVVIRGPLGAALGIDPELILLLVPFLWVSHAREVVTVVLRGTSNVGRAGGVDFIDVFGRVGVQVGLVVVGYEVFGLVGGAFAGAAAAVAIGTLALPIHIAKPGREHVRSLLSFAKFSFFRTAAVKTYMNVDTAVIALLLGPAAVSAYNVPFRLALGLSVFSTAVSTSSLPEISRNNAADRDERISVILTDAIVFSTFVAIPATVGIALLAEDIVVTLFTADFRASATVAVLAVAIQVPDSLRSLSTTSIDGLDRPDVSVRTDVLLVATNVALDLALVPILGIEGAAIASLVAVSAAGLYALYSLFELVEAPASAFPARPLAMEVLAAAVMGAVVFSLREALALPRLWRVILLVPVGAAVYGVTVLLISPAIRRRAVGIAEDVVPVELPLE